MSRLGTPGDMPSRLVVLRRDYVERQMQLIGRLTGTQVRGGRQRHSKPSGVAAPDPWGIVAGALVKAHDHVLGLPPNGPSAWKS